MNKIGIYYAYWRHDWKADFVEYIHRVADLGFQALEINTIGNLTTAEKNKIRDAAKERNIELSQSIGLTTRNDISSPNAETRKRGMNFLKKEIIAMAKVGGKKVNGVTYASWPSKPPKDVDKRAYIDRSVAVMKEVIKTAEDRDILVTLEVVNRFEGFLMNTVDECLDYIRQVGSPNLKAHLDTFHMNIEEDSIRGAIEKVGDKLGHLHVGENNRRPPGYGSIPWKDLAEALHKINYTNSIIMEPFILEGGSVARAIALWRDLQGNADLDEEAKKALHFIQARLAEAAG